MTTQEEYDDFIEENQDRLKEMRSELNGLYLEFLEELEDLGLDEDNSDQIVSDIFSDPFSVGTVG